MADPGSEWRLHRHWYGQSAMGDLLGRPAEVVGAHTLYRCLDRLLVHKRAFFSFLRERWEIDARFDVLLYDLTSTYFESDPTFEGKRRFGYSRDTDRAGGDAAGLPAGLRGDAGQHRDKTTLADFLARIEAQYGRLHTDRGDAEAMRDGASGLPH